MRGGGGHSVEDLAARGRAAHVVIPRTFPELTPPNHASRAATVRLRWSGPNFNWEEFAP